MKLCLVVFGLLAACAITYAQLPMPLQPRYQPQVEEGQMVVVPQQNRQKRSLLLGALGVGALGAGALGLGALGAGALGAGIIGAKAGFIGGAIASKAFSGRSYGGGYGGGYGHGYGGEYYAAPVYASPVIYGGGYRSYPSYYVEDEWC